MPLQFNQYVVIFNGDEEDLSWVHEIQNAHQKENKLDCLVYVPLRGTKDRYLYPHLFLVENYEYSLENHFLWNGILDEKDQRDYIFKKAKDFFEKGERLVIEHYDFQEDEPFYDYSR